VRFEDAPFEENKSTEFRKHAQSLGEPYLAGDDLSDAWRHIRSAFHAIESMNYRYWPQGVNSNTIIDATLARSVNHPTYRDGTAGNDEWTASDRQNQHTVWTPGLDQLPPPPERRAKPHPYGRQRAEAISPKDLPELTDEEFARATDGARWRQMWVRG
jgi:hypothetical protein